MSKKILNFIFDTHSDICILSVLLLASVYLHGLGRYQVVGALVFGSATYFWILARIQLGNSFSLFPKAKELVAIGIYKRIRHPIYVFSTLAVLGVTISFQTYKLLIVPAVVMCIEILRARREETILSQKFGTAYEDHKKRTWF